MTFAPFFWDANQWSGAVRTTEDFFVLLGYYDIDTVCHAKMAPPSAVRGLPKTYTIGMGRLPSFGLRREHIHGAVLLEDWARVRGVNLRELASRRPIA